MITPVTITKKEAAAIILEKALEGRVKGGSYIRMVIRADERGAINKGDRCSIGWLFPEGAAFTLESGPACEYLRARELIKGGLLVTDDNDWFMDLQSATDIDRLGSDGAVIKMCQAALEA